MLDVLIGLAIVLGSSCDISSAAMGQCGCGSSEASFTICATKSQTQTVPAKTATKTTAPTPPKKVTSQAPKPRVISPAKAKPVQNPTSCQEIWNVAAAKGGCSKPKPPAKQAVAKPKPVVTKTISEPLPVTINLSDEATGYAPVPIAYWSPGGAIYLGQSATVFAVVSSQLVDLELLGEPAQIRFTPQAISWQSSLGEFSGSKLDLAFNELGNFGFTANVAYQVDYRIGNDDWVINAGSVSAQSNTVWVTVIDPPRRTLLVG